MAHVAEAVGAGHLRRRPVTCDERARRRGSRPGARADVVRREAGRGSRRHRSSGEHVGPGDVVDVHEVAHLPAVLEDLRRLAALDRGAEHRRDAGVRRVAGHPAARRRCGSAAPPRCRRPAGPRRRRSAPGRACSRRRRCAGRAGSSSSTSAQSRGPEQTGHGFSKPAGVQVDPDAAPRAAADRGRARVAALAVDHHRARPGPAGPRRASCIAASSAAVPRSLWEAYAGRSATRTPSPTSAAWWQTTSTPRSRSTQAAASRTSSWWVPCGGSAAPWACGSIRSTPHHLVARRRSALRPTAEPMKPAEPVRTTLTGSRR